ncbi:MAG TPA: DedA family protein [Verrucomicrobiae bacterium]|nr:DedA family protein [Verrucomicrobiae bacterium]
MTHSIFELLRYAVVHYGYWGVAGILLLENAGIPAPGESVLLLASFLAYSEHNLQLGWIIVVAILAATVGDNLGFAAGYYGGRPLLERYQSFFRVRSDTIAKGEDLFARFGAATIFFSRFVFGMRIIAGPMAGVLRMPWKKFLIFNFLGAAVWVTTISTVGYLFGRHWERLQQDVGRVNLGIVLVVLLAGLWWWRRSRTKL